MNLVPVSPAALDRSPAARLVSSFLSGRKETTLRAYRAGLEDFRAWSGAATVDEAARALLSLPHGEANARALDYRNALLAAKKAPATVALRLSALSALVKLARTVGLVPWTLEVSAPSRQTYRDTRGPGLDGFRRLVAELEGRKDAKALRDRAVLRLLFDLALRRVEVVRLDVADVDLAAGTVSVLGKGRAGKEALTLPDSTKAALREWLAVRGPEAGPLFRNFDRARKGGRLTGTSLYRLVRGLGAAVGLRTRPHGIRHAAITEALNRTNGNLRTVARFSRHRDSRVLGLYDDSRLDHAGDVARLVAGAV